MSRPFQCDNTTDCRSKLADWLIEEGLVRPEKADINGDGETTVGERAKYALFQLPDWLYDKKDISREFLDLDKNGTVSFEEAAVYILKDSRFKEYLVAIDKTGLRHPLDTRNVPDEIKTRIAELRKRAEEDIGLDPDDPGYCGKFGKAFFGAGKKPFNEGGVCLDYPIKYTPAEAIASPELTVAQAFSACLDSSLPYGSCTEATYKFKAAIEMAGVPCEVSVMATEGHAYPAMGGESLDPADIGEIGWKKKVESAALYYGSLHDSEFGDLAPAMEPTVFYNAHELRILAEDGKYAELLDKLDGVVGNNYPTGVPFEHLSSITLWLSYDEGFQLGMTILKRWPDNPHALTPLFAILKTPEEMLLTADLIDSELPLSGRGDVVRMSAAQVQGRPEDVNAYASEAILKGDGPGLHAAFWMASELLQKGAVDAAIAIGRMVEERAPNFVGLHMFLSSALQAKGELEEARKETEKEMVVRWQRNPYAFLSYAQLLLSMGRPVDALEQLKGIIDAYSQGENDSATRALLASALSSAVFASMMAGNIESARESAVMFAGLSQDGGFVNLLMAIVEFAAVDIDAAEKHLAASGLYRMGAAGIQVRAYLDILKGEFRDAGQKIEILAGTMGDNYQIDFLRGWLASNMGDLKRAREEFRRASEKNKYDFSSRVLDAYIEAVDGDVGECGRMVEKLEKDFPQVMAVREAKAFYLLRTGKYEEAMDVAQAILENNPDNGTAMQVLIHAYLETNKSPNLHFVQLTGLKLTERIPANAAGPIITARAYLKAGNLKKAREAALEAKKRQKFDPVKWPLMSTSAILKEIEDAQAARSGSRGK